MNYLLILILGLYSIAFAPIRTNKYYSAKTLPLSQAPDSLDKSEMLVYGLTGVNDGVEKDSLVVVIVTERAVLLSDADNKVIREYKVQSVDTGRIYPTYQLVDKKGNVAYFAHYITSGKWNQFYLRTDSTIEIFSHGKGFLYERRPDNPFKRN